MNLNLDTLKEEILSYLASEGFVVFPGYSHLGDADSFVSWDTSRHPDFREFLGAARQVGAKLIVYHEQVFSQELLEETAERLEVANFPGDERRGLERRLRDFGPYEGFTCTLGLSFDCLGRMYVFQLTAEWYEDYLDLADEIDAAQEEPEEDESLGGYYSSN